VGRLHDHALGGGAGHLIPRRLALGLGRLRPAFAAVVLAALLALLPFPVCLIRLTLGIPCPGCGFTRAMIAAARLDPVAATRWHPLALPLLALAGVAGVLAFVAGDAGWRRFVGVATGVAGVALVGVWVLRFAGCFGGPVP
jgi:hypothetical protein